MIIRILAAAAVLMIVFGTIGSKAQKNSSDTYRQLELFGDVFDRVRADYVEKISDEKLIESAINGMLTSLDPHSGYMSPKTQSKYHCRVYLIHPPYHLRSYLLE